MGWLMGHFDLILFSNGAVFGRRMLWFEMFTHFCESPLLVSLKWGWAAEDLLCLPFFLPDNSVLRPHKSNWHGWNTAVWHLSVLNLSAFDLRALHNATTWWHHKNKNLCFKMSYRWLSAKNKEYISFDHLLCWL